MTFATVAATMPRMKFGVSAARLVIAIATLITAASLAAQEQRALAIDNLTDEEFRTLVDKTNLYVTALNAVSGARRSYDRYASWVDVKKGPTGKERYITYGLYEINESSVTQVKEAAQKGPAMKPALPELDSIVVRLGDAFTALAPLVKKAHDYYDQEDFKDDAAKTGRELHSAMIPLFEKTFAAEAELRRELDRLKNDLDQRQLARMEKQTGRDYHWHLRSFMLAAKALINLIPESPDAPLIDSAAYKTRYTELERTYTAFESFKTEHPEAASKIMLAGFVDSAVKDFYAASKFLRRTLESGKPDRRQYIEQVGKLAEKYNDLIQRTNSVR